MLSKRSLLFMISVGILTLGAGMASGQQNYPNKPIRIVASGVGGGGDFAARLIAQGISGPLGQNVIVENRPSNVSAEVVAKAPPDGYTLLLAGSTFLIGPLLEKTAYDPVRDFSPIALVTSAPNILVVHPSLPVKSVKELIALAKAKPGLLNYAAGGIGGSTTLSAELFKAMADVRMVGVPYKSDATQMADLVGGQVQLTFGTLVSVMPHVKSGKLRALAVTSAQPSALAPGLPTIAASVPEYETIGIQSILAPAGTPATTVNRLNQEIVRALNQADMKQKFLAAGVETVGSSPEKLAATMNSEMLKWGKVIKDAGIKAE